ncbi:unnamed protein product [Symbiodinium sp. CCMP2592]|nr:unnamed protein product [Symbiodinium sp. CCMP2592]
MAAEARGRLEPALASRTPRRCGHEVASTKVDLRHNRPGCSVARALSSDVDLYVLLDLVLDLLDALHNQFSKHLSHMGHFDILELHGKWHCRMDTADTRPWGDSLDILDMRMHGRLSWGAILDYLYNNLDEHVLDYLHNNLDVYVLDYLYNNLEKSEHTASFGVPWECLDHNILDTVDDQHGRIIVGTVLDYLYNDLDEHVLDSLYNNLDVYVLDYLSNNLDWGAVLDYLYNNLDENVPDYLYNSLDEHALDYLYNRLDKYEHTMSSGDPW